MNKATPIILMYIGLIFFVMFLAKTDAASVSTTSFWFLLAAVVATFSARYAERKIATERYDELYNQYHDLFDRHMALRMQASELRNEVLNLTDPVADKGEEPELSYERGSK